MTTIQAYAATLRSLAEKREALAEQYEEDARAETLRAAIPALIAGAEALEAQGRWLLKTYRHRLYFVPVEREINWLEFLNEAEPGEYTARVPECAVLVRPNVVITGWEG